MLSEQYCAYGNLTTPYRTTTTTYLTGTNYTSRNILNRPAQVVVCAGTADCATPASVTTFAYENTSLAIHAGVTQHDPAYGRTFLYCGNPTRLDAKAMVWPPARPALRRWPATSRLTLLASTSAGAGRLSASACAGLARDCCRPAPWCWLTVRPKGFEA